MAMWAWILLIPSPWAAATPGAMRTSGRPSAFLTQTGPWRSTQRAAISSLSPPVARLRMDTPTWVKPWKSEREKLRDAWEIGDAYRPGEANQFTPQPRDLVQLHQRIKQLVPYTAGAEPPERNTSMAGVMLRTLSTGNSTIESVTREPKVMTELRRFCAQMLPMKEGPFSLPVEHGRLLSVITMAMEAEKVLDIGSFTGYSSICCALALRPGTQVLSCEPNPVYAQIAGDWHKRAAVEDKIKSMQCSGIECMQSLLKDGEEGTFDIVFVDADHATYPSYLDGAVRLLKVGGVVAFFDTLWAVDHNLQHAPMPEVREFNAVMAADPRLMVSLLPLSYGITIGIKVMDVPAEQLEQALQQESLTDFHELLLERRSQLVDKLQSLEST